jgi:hypothetical protein
LGHHNTPDELAEYLGESPEDVLSHCRRLGVPVVHGRIDRVFFLSALASDGQSISEPVLSEKSQ